MSAAPIGHVEALMCAGDVPDLLAQLVERPAWMRDALCREHPTTRFFPEVGRSAACAKRICEGCLVREECLEYALEHHEEHGVWGGMTPAARRALRRSSAA